MKETQRIDNGSVNDDLFACKLNGALFKNRKKRKQIKNGKKSSLFFLINELLNNRDCGNCIVHSSNSLVLVCLQST